MDKKLNEKEALEKLGVDSFRQITKEKIITFLETVSDMDNDIALKAMDQIPRFKEMVIEVLKETKETASKSIDANTESHTKVLEMYDKTIEALLNDTKKDLSFEEKQYYIDKVQELLQEANKKDSENKNFLFSNNKLVAGAGLIAIMGGLYVLSGGKIKLPIKII